MLDKLTAVPVDIEPQFTTADELEAADSMIDPLDLLDLTDPLDPLDLIDLIDPRVAFPRG